MQALSGGEAVPALPLPLTIVAADLVLRRRLGRAAAAAGFVVVRPADPVTWARGQDGVVVLALDSTADLTLLAQLRSASRRLIVLALVGADARELGLAALRAGAHVMDRSVEPDELLLTVRLARRGRVTVPAPLLDQLVEQRRGAPAVGPATTLGLDSTDRALLQDLADGATNQRIARSRHIATRTVERQLQRVYARIGAGDRVQAVATAVQCGLVRFSVPPSTS